MKHNEITGSQKQKAFEAVKTIPFVNLLGMEMVELSNGEAIFKLEMREELRQPHGLLHGGATASLIDTAMAFAVVTCLAKDEKASTVDLTVHYLRPVVKGSVTCTAKIVKAGKRLLTVSAEVVSDEEKLIATALSTYSKV
jgi:acyl-CoA thioesterase